MKKIYILVIMLIGLTALSACGRSDTLKIGMDLKYPPFETTVEDSNKPMGISVDIAMALGEHLGREVEIVNTDFKSLIPALQSGEIDAVISSMSITDKRKEIIDFSDSYMSFKIISLVNQEFADENNLTTNSTKEDLLAVENIKFTGLASQVSTTIPESYGKEVMQTTSLATAIESVTQGTADVLLMSANPVADGKNANPNTTMIVWDPFETSPIGVGVKKGNSDLLSKINDFVASMDDEGGLYEQLSDKYDETIKERLGGRGFEYYIKE